jgi:hypothetical protein
MGGIGALKNSVIHWCPVSGCDITLPATDPRLASTAAKKKGRMKSALTEQNPDILGGSTAVAYTGTVLGIGGLPRVGSISTRVRIHNQIQ